MAAKIWSSGKRMRGAALLAGALALTVLAGCGGDSQFSRLACTPEAVSEASLNMDPGTVTPRAAAVATPTPAPARAVSSATPPPPTFTAPLTDAQLAACLNPTPRVSPLPIVAAAPAPVVEAAPAPVQEALPLSRAGWDVPLGREWRHIVVHHSDSDRGNAAIFHQAHLARGWDGLGYHFVIGNGSDSGDGEVEVGYRWSRQARGAHAGNDEYNEHGIGICLVGNFDDTQPSPRQMAALRQLVRYLQARCHIATNQIIGHRDVPGKSTACPGKHFSLDEFRASLSKISDPAPSAAAAAPNRIVVSSSGLP